MTEDFSHVSDEVERIKIKISDLLAAISSLDSSECLTSVSVTFKTNGNNILYIPK